MTYRRSTRGTKGRGRPSLDELSTESPLPYHSRGYLLTQEEQLFVRALHPGASAHGLGIFAKPRLADVLNCSEEAWRLGHGTLLGRRHVDFVLCSNIARIEVGIELDDPSHAHRADRDDFLDRAFEAAGVRLLRFPVRQRYDASEISRVLGEALRQA